MNKIFCVFAEFDAFDSGLNLWIMTKYNATAQHNTTVKVLEKIPPQSKTIQQKLSLQSIDKTTKWYYFHEEFFILHRTLIIMLYKLLYAHSCSRKFHTRKDVGVF